MYGTRSIYGNHGINRGDTVDDLSELKNARRKIAEQKQNENYCTVDMYYRLKGIQAMFDREAEKQGKEKVEFPLIDLFKGDAPLETDKAPK